MLASRKVGRQAVFVAKSQAVSSCEAVGPAFG